MRLGAALFLIAVGAILKFAVTDKVSGVDLGVVGIILMIVGVVGLIAELAYSASRRRTRVVHEQRVVDPELRRY
ncbi:DUF6458 family protein [Jatrophihabitans fulvus]